MIGKRVLGKWPDDHFAYPAKELVDVWKHSLPGRWRPLAEQYVQPDGVGVHLHIRVSGTTAGEYCLFFKRPAREDLHPSAADDVGALYARHKQGDTPMLVEVGEFLEDPERFGSEVLPSTVRLGLLNVRPGPKWDTGKTPPTNCVFEIVAGGRDGELKPAFDLPFESAADVGSGHIPDQVVECRPKVLDRVSEQEREPFRGLPLPNEIDRLRACLRVYLLDNSVRATLAPPFDCEFEGVEMLPGAPDLDGVGTWSGLSDRHWG